MPFEWGSAVDISGEGNDGTLVGNVNFNETGGLNQTGGFEFDFVAYPNVEAIGIGTGSDFSDVCKNGCTFSAWAYKKDGTSHETIIGRSDTTSDNQFFTLKVTSEEDVEFTIYENGSAPFCQATKIEDIALNTWIHYVGVFDNSTGTGNVSVYKDGAHWDSTPCTFSGINVTAWADDEPTFIGAHDAVSGVPAGNGWNGSIDQVMIWNRSLSADEISALYTNQSAKHNVPYYTAYQNLSGGGNDIFTIDAEADFIFPDFQFHAGNRSSQFYTPILSGDVVLDVWNVGGEPPEPEVTNCTCYYDSPKVFNMSDYCNITTPCDLGAGGISWTGSGWTNCSATINTTNMARPDNENQLLLITKDCIINIFNWILGIIKQPMLPSVGATSISNTNLSNSGSGNFVQVDYMTLTELVINDTAIELYNVSSIGTNFTNVNPTSNSSIYFYGLIIGLSVFHVDNSNYLFNSTVGSQNYPATFETENILRILSILIAQYSRVMNIIPNVELSIPYVKLNETLKF